MERKPDIIGSLPDPCLTQQSQRPNVTALHYSSELSSCPLALASPSSDILPHTLCTGRMLLPECSSPQLSTGLIFLASSALCFPRSLLWPSNATLAPQPRVLGICVLPNADPLLSPSPRPVWAPCGQGWVDTVLLSSLCQAHRRCLINACGMTGRRGRQFRWEVRAGKFPWALNLAGELEPGHPWWKPDLQGWDDRTSSEVQCEETLFSPLPLYPIGLCFWEMRRPWVDSKKGRPE